MEVNLTLNELNYILENIKDDQFMCVTDYEWNLLKNLKPKISKAIKQEEKE